MNSQRLLLEPALNDNDAARQQSVPDIHRDHITIIAGPIGRDDVNIVGTHTDPYRRSFMQ